MDSGFMVVTTMIDSEEAARGLARSAVTERLAACAQVSAPVSSVYWWDHAICESDEWTVVFKTTSERYAALAEYIRAAHSYEVPEIIGTSLAAGDPPYLAWIRKETNGV